MITLEIQLFQKSNMLMMMILLFIVFLWIPEMLLMHLQRASFDPLVTFS